MNTAPTPPHIPVLLESTLQYLAPKAQESYLDLTAGYGGHARAILERTQAPSRMTLVDRDQNAIVALQALAAAGAEVLHDDFLAAARHLIARGQRYDMVLADLGVSSPQLDVAERGFSFRYDASLDMRMDQRQALTAATVVNEWGREELATLIRRFGEEPLARRITDAIISHRPLTTTKELAAAIGAVVPPHKRSDATARTFQAIRIAVNGELSLVEAMLRCLPDLLTPAGRVAVISFHSLEDRLVKRYFVEEASAGYEAQLQLLTKRPVAGNLYDVTNPRARSAKLRAAVKINSVR